MTGNANRKLRSDLVTHQPCCSLALVRPFSHTLSLYPAIPAEVLGDLKKIDLDDRIPLAAAYSRIQNAIAVVHDLDLGLKAAREVVLGDAGVLDYAMSSAATIREAVDVAARYGRLISDTIDFRLRIEDGRAAVMINSSVDVPRAVLDFILAMFYKNHFSVWPHGVDSTREIYFSYRGPAQTFEHKLAFPGANVSFSAPFDGFVFAASDLDQLLTTANPTLHFVICKHAQSVLARLHPKESIADIVRELVVAELANGGSYEKRISDILQISARTLIRKLEKEGTSFRDVVDDVRQQLARSYAGSRDIDFTEVARLLGYIHASSFHRSFKRWTGGTATEYRRRSYR